MVTIYDQVSITGLFHTVISLADNNRKHKTTYTVKVNYNKHY